MVAAPAEPAGGGNLADVPRGDIRRILDTHEAILFDAYGVLIDGNGALPGAADLVRELNAKNKPFFVITNGACHSSSNRVAGFRRMGIEVDEAQIISSGDVLQSYLEDNGWRGKSAVVLGPAGAVQYVTAAGLKILSHADALRADAIVVADQTGFPFVEAVDDVLSALFQRLDEDPGRAPALLLANPDLYYPAGAGRVGITSGLVGNLIESALQFRYGAAAPRFVPLGKPHAPIFEEASRRAGTRKLVMFGDLVQTDIRGAVGFGITAVLVGCGLTNLNRPLHFARNEMPTYWVQDLVV